MDNHPNNDCSLYHVHEIWHYVVRMHRPSSEDLQARMGGEKYGSNNHIHRNRLWWVAESLTCCALVDQQSRFGVTAEYWKSWWKVSSWKIWTGVYSVIFSVPFRALSHVEKRSSPRTTTIWEKHDSRETLHVQVSSEPAKDIEWKNLCIYAYLIPLSTTWNSDHTPSPGAVNTNGKLLLLLNDLSYTPRQLCQAVS